MTKPMHISRAALFPLLALAPVILFGQAPAPATAAAPAAPVAPSSLVQPPLSTVESTLNALKLDKWKKGSVREEAGDNVKAILQDIKNNVPPLLSDADAAPGALSKSIPLLKHLDALYDVLLRVEEGARVSAPSDQIDQLAAALKQFGTARIQLYDAMAERATGQEKQVADLQAAIKAHEAAALEHKPAPAAAPAPCTPPKPATHKKRTAPKPAQPAPAQPAPTQPAPTPPKPQ
jgi:hypothetical protein